MANHRPNANMPKRKYISSVAAAKIERDKWTELLVISMEYASVLLKPLIAAVILRFGKLIHSLPSECTPRWRKIANTF